MRPAQIMEDTSSGSSMAANNPRWLAPEVLDGQKASLASVGGWVQEDGRGMCLPKCVLHTLNISPQKAAAQQRAQRSALAST